MIYRLEYAFISLYKDNQSSFFSFVYLSVIFYVWVGGTYTGIYSTSSLFLCLSTLCNSGGSSVMIPHAP